MPTDLRQRRSASGRALIGLVVCLTVSLAAACETPNPRPNLPPSESDLVLLKPGTLCQRKTDFLQQHPQSSLTIKPWGTGQELMLPASRSPSHGDESFFFSADRHPAGAPFTVCFCPEPGSYFVPRPPLIAF